MSKQTAVEWLETKVNGMIENGGDADLLAVIEHIKQAKEMEKEQMKESFIVALDMLDFTILSNSTINESFEDYYNQTFKNK